MCASCWEKGIVFCIIIFSAESSMAHAVAALRLGATCSSSGVVHPAQVVNIFIKILHAQHQAGPGLTIVAVQWGLMTPHSLFMVFNLKPMSVFCYPWHPHVNQIKSIKLFHQKLYYYFRVRVFSHFYEMEWVAVDITTFSCIWRSTITSFNCLP